jgi:hypothetical protein
MTPSLRFLGEADHEYLASKGFEHFGFGLGSRLQVDRLDIEPLAFKARVIQLTIGRNTKSICEFTDKERQ